MKESHKKRFRELVGSGQIADLCRSRCTMNLPFPAAGGAVFWDSWSVDGWKLQENTVFGNWRILDPDNVRQAWGTIEAQLDAFLDDRPVSGISNYLDAGYAFSRCPGNRDETVILIHGWGVRAYSMDRLADMFRREGYTVLNYDYPTSRRRIEQHAETLLELYRREHLQGKIRFLTHSMGGLLLRYALAKMTESECRAIDSVVMLGPPNKGSLLALFGELGFVKEFNRSLADMVPGSDALRIPKPPYLPPVGIIAGTRDGKVSLESTGLPDGLPFERATVGCNHPELRDPRRTGMLIRHFFQHKTFKNVVNNGESQKDAGQ